MILTLFMKSSFLNNVFSTNPNEQSGCALLGCLSSNGSGSIFRYFAVSFSISSAILEKKNEWNQDLIVNGSYCPSTDDDDVGLEWMALLLEQRNRISGLIRWFPFPSFQELIQLHIALN